MQHELTCVCTTLNKAKRAMTRVYDEALTDAGMTAQQFSILSNLAETGPIATSRLADRLMLDRTSLYRALSALERAGWAERVASGHGRARIVALTAAGEAALETAAPAWQATQARIVAGFGTERWDALVAALADLSAEARP